MGVAPIELAVEPVPLVQVVVNDGPGLTFLVDIDNPAGIEGHSRPPQD